MYFFYHFYSTHANVVNWFAFVGFSIKDLSPNAKERKVKQSSWTELNLKENINKTKGQPQDGRNICQ